MKTVQTLFVSIALLWSFDIHAQGLIWSRNFLGDGLGGVEGGGPPGNREVVFDYVPDPNFPSVPNQNLSTRIFSMTISTNDAGHTFFANALNEPGFAGFVAGLTDGANGYIRFSDYGYSQFGTSTESDFLGRSTAAPDLAGYNITQIGFRVNDYYDSFYAPENRYLNTLNYSLDFYGAPVPEPGTWALLTLGAATGLLMRRKVRKQLPAPRK